MYHKYKSMIRLFIVLAFIPLYGAGSCVAIYMLTRDCTQLTVTVHQGSRGIPLPDCLGTVPMEITDQEQITFTGVPNDLKVEIVPVGGSNVGINENLNEILISANDDAAPGTETMSIHTQPLGKNGPITPHDYVVTVTIKSVISGIFSIINETSANINWTTEMPATSQVEYGTDTTYGSSTTIDTTFVTSHSQTISGLSPSTTYHYRVTSAPCITCFPFTSGDNTFTTLGTNEAFLTVSASPVIVNTGHSTTLSAIVTGGVGPFDRLWRGYRDDGTPFSFTSGSSTTVDQPSVGLESPSDDFYFFVTVTDNGILAGQPGHTLGGYVRVHESDGPVAIFSVIGGPFHVNVTDVLFDASASTGVTTPIFWELQYFGNVPKPADIEGYLVLDATSWTGIYKASTDLMTLDVPASTFINPGVYRMFLQVNNGIEFHQTYEYFYVNP